MIKCFTVSNNSQISNVAGDSPLVSVIMPLYNAEKTIRDSINSVLTQTYRKIELLIVDDCSKDRGPMIVSAIAKLDRRVRLFRLENNKGAGVARNTAIMHSSGRYIAFLDADDQWAPSKIEVQLETFRKYDVALVCSGYAVVNAKYEHRGFRQPGEWITYETLLKENVIGCLTAIYDVGKVGRRFMPEIRKRQDYALWLEILREFGPAYCVQEHLAQYCVHAGSISSKKFELIKWNYLMFRVSQNFSPAYAFFLTLGNAVSKLGGRWGGR